MVPSKRPAPGEDVSEGNPKKTCPAETLPTPPPTPRRLSGDSPCPERPEPAAPCVSPLHAVTHAAPASPVHTPGMDSQREPDVVDVTIDTMVAGWPGPTGAALIQPNCTKTDNQSKSNLISESNATTPTEPQATSYQRLHESILEASKTDSEAIHDEKDYEYMNDDPIVIRKYRNINPASEPSSRDGSMQYVHEKFLNDFGVDIFDEDDME